MEKPTIWQRAALFLLSSPSDLAVYRNSPWRSFVHDLPWGFYLLAMVVGLLCWWML